MNPKPQRVPDYLEHMLMAIDRAMGYTAGLTLAGFLQSPITQDAVVRSFEVLGEAVRHIRLADPDFLLRHPATPWGKIYGFRNRLIHDYFDVDPKAVWQTVHEELPALRPQIEAILAGRVAGAPADRIEDVRARYEAERWWHEAAEPDERLLFSIG